MEAMAADKGQPFSVRFSRETDIYIDAEAKRTKRSRSAVVEDLALEAAKSRRFPGIAFRGDWPAREPYLVGIGFDVWELCETIDNYGSVKKVVDDFPQVTELHCRVARLYREAYPEEIDSAIAENNRSVEEWRALYPFIEWTSAAERWP